MKASWGTPRSCQGSSPKISFLFVGSLLLRRASGRGDGEVTYAMARLSGADWGWATSYEPGGALEPPPLPEDRWQEISAGRANELIDLIESGL